MYLKSSYLRAAGAVCLLSVAPFMAYAQNASQDSDDALEEVVVRAHPLSAEKFAQPIATLDGSELQIALEPSLAETLAGLPGVHSSSYGQAVGRPVIRGLGGPRVKTMEDRIDSLDVSVSSPDHAPTLEPFTAQSIEVLKGPATLLYGTGAIGGVVDVHTGRIPHQVPEKLSGGAEIRAADNGDRQTAAVRLDGGSGSIAFHLDAFYRDADEYDIPFFGESAAQRAREELEEEEHEEEEGHDEDGHEEEEEVFGRLENSQLEARGGAGGLSYVGERGFIGLSVSTYQAEYGLPGGHGHHEEEEEGEEEHEEEEEGGAFLDLDQTRVDIEAGLSDPFAGFTNLNVRLGYNDYEHVEFEGSGERGTVFTNEALEGRLELVHEAGSDYEGATGVQISTRDFSAIGEEAFVQPVDTRTVGIFYVGRRQFDSTALEFGVRYENVDHDPTSAASRSFDLGAASVGLTWDLTDSWTFSGTLDYSNRAPVAEELYSDGPHLATNSFEIGDPNLDEETAANISATLEYADESFNFMVSAFYTDFGDFIYESATGEEEDELRVFQWLQDDASFSGFEADVGWEALTWGDGGLTLNAGLDVVRGRLDSGANRNLPRIPPLRTRVGATVNWQNFMGQLTFTRADNQRDIAPEELPTGGYDDLRVHLSYGINLRDSRRLELFLTGRNLTDDEQRYHTSFIKDFAPQAGRTIEAGVNFRL
ncbi:MAG: TonB-dependent receptor [Pseudomonadota bacterium]